MPELVPPSVHRRPRSWASFSPEGGSRAPSLDCLAFRDAQAVAGAYAAASGSEPKALPTLRKDHSSGGAS